jgi:hypothetical protein
MGEGATSNLKPIRHPPYTQGGKTSRSNGGPWRQTCGHHTTRIPIFSN